MRYQWSSPIANIHNLNVIFYQDL